MRIKMLSEKEKLPKDTVKVEFSDSKEVKFATDKNGKEKLILGLGKKRNDINHRDFFVLCRKLIRTAKDYKIRNLALDFKDFDLSKIFLGSSTPSWELNSRDERMARIMGEQFAIADFDFEKYKNNKEQSAIEIIFVIGAPQSLDKEFKKGLLIGQEVNQARELANTPGGDMTPSVLAQKAREAARGTNIRVSVFDEKKIKELKMGAILGVSKGSHEKPRFIIMEYRGLGSSTPKRDKRPIILVGKGVTFDTGGLSLKPFDGMLGMHLDMSGGAVVIYAISAIAKLGLKKNVIVLVPAVENMPSGDSYRPGDILKTMSGKTVEVLNTDAEGRLILADALTYAERYNPKLVVDVATLTGAAAVALGERCSAIFTKDKKLQEIFQEAGEQTGEYVWPLPLWEEYEEDIKGDFADWTNVHKDNSRYGGAIHGAVFLQQFAQNYPWAHIDMAPRMTAGKNDYLAKGATGEPLKLLLKIIEEY